MYTMILYLALCIAAGYFGRNRRIGFWGFFFLSVFASPIVSMLYLYFTTSVDRELGDV